MEALAVCRVRLQDFDSAREMMEELCELSHDALGYDDPRTRLRERHLERLNNSTASDPSSTTKKRLTLNGLSEGEKIQGSGKNQT
jgi:hypothetical protein